MSYMPFHTTAVAPEKTMLQIKKLLYEIGFTKLAEISKKNGDTALVAEIAGEDSIATFKFEVHLDIVMDNLSINGYEKRRLQAARIAWRIVFNQIKGVHDAVKWGIQSITEAFGGNMLLPDAETGRPRKVADLLVEATVQNRLGSQILSCKLLPAPDKDVKP